LVLDQPVTQIPKTLGLNTISLIQKMKFVFNNFRNQIKRVFFLTPVQLNAAWFQPGDSLTVFLSFFVALLSQSIVSLYSEEFGN